MLDQNKIDMYIMTNQKYFPAEKIMYLKDKVYSVRLQESPVRPAI